MDNIKKPRGVKKGESPQWNVGRKSIDEKEKSVNRSVTLPAKIWDELDKIAENKGYKRGNQLAAEIVKKFYELF